MSYTFVVNSRSTGPGSPPSMNEGTFKVSEGFPRYEYELVQEIFKRFGPGHYTVLCNFNNKKGYDDDRVSKGMKALWKGKIEVEDDEDLTYISFENLLIEKTWIGVREPPLEKKWKRCVRPSEEVFRGNRENPAPV